MNNKLIPIFAAAVLLSAALFFSACDPYEGAIREETRNITVDIDNSMFLEPGAANLWEQGPGIDTLTITFVLDSGDVVKEFSASDATGEYTQLVQEVTGRLKRVDAAAVNAAGTAMQVSIDDKTDYEEIYGWETFANLQRFRLGCNSNSADNWADGFLTLDIAPRGGTALRFKIDSGVTASMTTDWGGAPLTSLQLAVEPVLSENPAGITFDIYTLIVNEDLRAAYKPGYLNSDADYLYNFWTDVWTYTELTESGRQISDTVYKMTKYDTGGSLPFVEPSGEGSGYDSFLIDLSGETESPVGKFLMIAVISKHDVLSVPSMVEIIEIK